MRTDSSHCAEVVAFAIAGGGWMMDKLHEGFGKISGPCRASPLSRIDRRAIVHPPPYSVSLSSYLP